MVISSPRLLGTAPAIDPDLLADGMHQTAENVRFDSGAAEPWFGPSVVATPTKGSNVLTIYRYGDSVVGDANYWFNLLGDGDFSRGPIADDELERVYFTEDGQPPRMTRSDLAIGADLPNAYRLLGLPQPDVSGVTTTVTDRTITDLSFLAGVVTATVATALELAVGEEFNAIVLGAAEEAYNGDFVATVSGANTFTYAIDSSPASPATGTPVYRFGGSYEDRVYLLSWIGDGNEVGPASDPITVRVGPGQIVTLNNLPTSATWTDRTGSTVVSSKRIWQSVGEGYAREGDISLATTTFQSTGIPTSQTFLPDLLQLAPPADLRSIKAMADGPMIGLSGEKEVCFSEPGLPHAWPTEYRQTLDYPHVGIGIYGHSAIVFTTAYPYVFTGTDPRAMTAPKTMIKQGSVSKRSIADAGFGVFMASPDGLILVSDAGAPNVLEALMTKRQWEALDPTSILGVFHDGRYFGFYDNGATQGGFIYRHAEKELTWTDIHATAAYTDERTDSLYLLIGGVIKKWDGDIARLSATLKSKRYRVRRRNMGAAKIIADSYPVTFRYYADGELKQTKVVTSDAPFRLKSGFRPDFVEYEMEFTDKVLPLQVADSPEELV